MSDLPGFTYQCTGVGPDYVSHMRLRVLPRQQIVDPIVADPILVILVVPGGEFWLLVFIVPIAGIIVVLV